MPTQRVELFTNKQETRLMTFSQKSKAKAIQLFVNSWEILGLLIRGLERESICTNGKYGI